MQGLDWDPSPYTFEKKKQSLQAILSKLGILGFWERTHARLVRQMFQQRWYSPELDRIKTE